MNKYIFIAVCFLSVTVTLTSCEETVLIESPVIQGLTLSNYPKVDGSTTTAPLNVIIACRTLGINYKWAYKSDGHYAEPVLDKKNTETFWKRVKTSQTHPSFIKLINKETDLILSARRMSSDEKAQADAAGISLIETPIALDAFIFIIHPENPVESLTKKQVQGIYTGEIKYWNEVGGNDADISPYVRNANSGSQEWMEMIVMKDLNIEEWPKDDFELIFSMAGALDVVSREINSICYTFHYYKEKIANDDYPKSLAIEGITPDWQTIKDNSYPYVAEVYAIIRSDLNESSMAYKLYEWLQTEAGKQVISESGFAPYY
jgi:phosphate transport system substrate-binding protein